MELSVADLLALHDERLSLWSSAGAPVDPVRGTEAPGEAQCATSLVELIEAAHFANFTIWGLEDEARRRDVGDARIAAVKRAIDPWNQKRNDLMEAVDVAVLDGFAKVDVASAELHSETAGMIVDRLSVLALKIHHMDRIAAEASREGDEALAAECRERAALLRVQRFDLASCLERLLADFAAGRRHFKNFRQLKSYNDARLNPFLRRAGGVGTEKGSR
jgi:hypothetical protein